MPKRRAWNPRSAWRARRTSFPKRDSHDWPTLVPRPAARAAFRLPRRLRTRHRADVRGAAARRDRSGRNAPECGPIQWPRSSRLARASISSSFSRTSPTRYAGCGAIPDSSSSPVLTLALGTGVNTAIFSIVHAVLLKPLPYADQGTLVTVMNRWDGSAQASMSEPEYLDYSEHSRTLEIAAMARGIVTVTGGAGEPERVASAPRRRTPSACSAVNQHLAAAFQPTMSGPVAGWQSFPTRSGVSGSEPTRDAVGQTAQCPGQPA